MASFKVLAGDFKKGGGNVFAFGRLGVTPEGESVFCKSIPGERIAEVALINEKTIKGDALCWAAVGALMWGLTGAALGALIGGCSRESVIFGCKLEDGRQFVGEGSIGLFEKLSAVVQKNKLKKEQAEALEKERAADPVGWKVKQSAKARWGRTA